MMSKPANDPPLFEWLSKVVFEIAANMAKKAACECQVNWKCKTANS
jgi:cytosine/adenosine deaminase-related metal-dependent hydrolase